MRCILEIQGEDIIIFGNVQCNVHTYFSIELKDFGLKAYKKSNSPINSILLCNVHVLFVKYEL